MSTRPELALLGYRHDDTGMPNRLFYRRSSAGVPTHHLLIQEFVDAARNARGLPLVPVWEE